MTPISPVDVPLAREILERSTDPERLQAAAQDLAQPGAGAEGLAALREVLGQRGFLARLDDLDTPSEKTRRLRRVFAALQERPDAAVAELCLALAVDPVFLEDPDRKDLLLESLARVVPMSEAAAQLFADTNREGYFAYNARLLADNGSPRALALYEEMMADAARDPEVRVDCLHAGLMPHRVEEPFVAMAERLLARGLELEVEAGVVESLFDHQGKRWFGPAIGAPEPPPWSVGATEVLERLLLLAWRLDAAGRYPALGEALRESAAEIKAVIAARRLAGEDPP